MLHKESFISQQFRPAVRGSTIDSDYEAPIKFTSKEMPRQILNVNAICFGPRKDNVLISLEHLADEKDEILFLYYEDIFVRWSYICDSGDIYFTYQKDESNAYLVRAKTIYMRGCMVTPESKYWSILGELYNLMSLWKGKMLCNPGAQMSNESKLFQLNNSLLSAAKLQNKIKIGTSFVVKGQTQYQRLNQKKSYIVKSLSGVRSVVVDASEYKYWNADAIDHLPVLFQEKVDGSDVRLHILDDRLYGKLSEHKESIDYRYDSHFFDLKTMRHCDESISSFCQTVARLENNNLMGIDFIKSKNTYYVLEANPCPGWSAYHPYNGIDTDDFLKHILNVLTHD